MQIKMHFGENMKAYFFKLFQSMHFVSQASSGEPHLCTLKALAKKEVFKEHMNF